MAATLPTHRRWAPALRWPFGVALASWRYMWSITPVHRWVMTGSWPEDAPPDLPAGAERPDLQRWQEGVGPLLHRIYRTRFTASELSPEELIGLLREDMDRIAPTEFATFRRLEGDGPMEVGDDYVVRMPGPWDGPVTVLAVAAGSFRLATLSGHLEAGQIEFRAASDHRGVSFEIEAWARSGDRLSDLLYTRVQISKEVQLHMWASTLRNAVELAGGKMEGGITITTRRLDPHVLPLGEGDPGEIDERDRRDLADLARRPVNFEPAELEAAPGGAGWRVDEMIEPLPHEAPGPPREGGSWPVAKRMLDDYQLADPLAVSGVYFPGRSLAGRDILLKVRYGPLRFRVGVRIAEPREETVELDGREVLRYGWSYRTLEGHFEAGEMRYELRKWLDSGDVEFRLRAVSRPARSGPLVPRLGFRLVGRPRQLRFYRQVCRRVRRLTEAQIETERARAARRRFQLAS
ncbi:MAG TPA: DUF1990 family protein [Solirubrobacterales bacterium]|nr:DUF1990 family protein [Solirubrobacterales bacterium]